MLTLITCTATKMSTLELKLPSVHRVNSSKGELSRPSGHFCQTLNFALKEGNLCITGFLQNCFSRILEKWVFWQSYPPLKYSFRCISNFFLDSGGAHSQNTFSKCFFFIHTMFHLLPDYYRDLNFKSYKSADNVLLLLMACYFKIY